MKINQSGGIVSFVVVGVVLAALLGGGLYLSKNFGRVAHDTKQTTSKAVTKTKEKVSEVKNDENKTETPVTTPTPAQPVATPVATTGPSDNVPSTGPKETFAGIIGFAGVTFAGYQLFQSRRSRNASALDR